MKVVVLLTLIGLAFASDYQCTKDGGSCLDYTNYKCTAGYESGLCDGDSNRKCCKDCSAVCLANESTYSQGDGACDDAGGDCMDNSNYCDGTYYSGKCGGPSTRQCCVKSGSSSGGGIIGGGGIGGNANTCYGDIEDVDTTGASSDTASQDNLWYSGVQASQSMAETDSTAMLQYKSEIEQAADSLCVQASVIAGIISRESRAGKALNAQGYGADGHGYGLMQVDDRYYTVEGGPYSLQHIKQGTGILINMINGVKANHPTWTQNQDLKGGISAYNAGVSNVVTYENMDVGTTGGDYSNDVTARAQWYLNDGY